MLYSAVIQLAERAVESIALNSSTPPCIALLPDSAVLNKDNVCPVPMEVLREPVDTEEPFIYSVQLVVDALVTVT